MKETKLSSPRVQGFYDKGHPMAAAIQLAIWDIDSEIAQAEANHDLKAIIELRKERGLLC